MNVSADNGGTVIINQNALPNYPADLTFSSGEQVSLEAVPAPGYLFRGWSGALSSTANPTTLVMDCNKSIVAKFSLPSAFQLTIQVDGMGSTSPHSGTYNFTGETTVSITAIAEKGWKFDRWTGDVIDPASPVIKVTVNTDKTCTANFSRILHDVTIQVNGQGTTVPPAGFYKYGEGIAITITAIPDKGWKFAGWTGDVADKKSPYAAVTIMSDGVYTANFSEAGSSGWLVGGGIGIILVVAIVAWFALRRRA